MWNERSLSVEFIGVVSCFISCELGVINALCCPLWVGATVSSFCYYLVRPLNPIFLEVSMSRWDAAAVWKQLMQSSNVTVFTVSRVSLRAQSAECHVMHSQPSVAVCPVSRMPRYAQSAECQHTHM